MAEVTTTKPVNLYQLGQEVGGTPAFRMVDDGTTRRIRTTDVTQQALDTAVASHTANPAVVPPPTPGEVAQAEAEANQGIVDARMAEAIADLTSLIGAAPVDTVPAGTMTTAQLSNAVRQLREAVQANRAGSQQVARVVRDLVRFVRGDFADID